MLWSIISAVNNDDVLKSSLLRSPDLVSAKEVILQRGFSNAARAYNSGIDKASADILVFVHQDVYLPNGWILDLEKAIQAIADQDPNWGVLGVYGATNTNGRAGYLYWTGLHGVAGKPFDGGIKVETLDELLLITRRSSGLRFDERMPGFHLYGADICVEATQRKMKSYAISAFCIHNTSEYKLLPVQFWKSYLFLSKKWKNKLPIATPCIELTRWGWPAIRWNIIHTANLALRRRKTSERTDDPSRLYHDFIRRGLISPTLRGPNN